ncbi:MAG: enoyl-CoA hydratase [Gammaproteobacteria bacterium]|nr:MAG: enoyl-CoA hydratase [Gammaproteobacteria bacterium]
MTDNNEIQVSTEQGIMSITFNRPDKKNALTNAMYKSINDALRQAETDEQIRVVLFSGNGDCFTAGNDIKDFLNNEISANGSEVGKTVKLLSAFKKPLVAAVHGNAVGIGTTMLLHCDLVVAAKNAIFAMPFVPLGLCAEAASSLLLPKMAGHQQAAEILLLGEAFNVEKADKLGIINRIVEVKEVKLQALALCQKLAALPVTSLEVTKALLKSTGDTVEQRILKEFIHFEKLLKSDDAKKAFKAFLAKAK